MPQLDSMNESQAAEESMDSTSMDESTDEKEEAVELSDELISEIRILIKKFATDEQQNRRSELLRAREGRSFWRGNQYSMFNGDAGTFVVPNSGGMPSASGDATDNNRFYYVTNIYLPYGRALISALAGTTPGVRFLPCDSFSSDDLDAAKEAEKQRKIFFYDVNVDQLMKDTVRYAWTDGRTVAWVKTIEDDNGKTKECVDLFGVLEHKCPIALRCQSEFPYQQISYEKSSSEIKSDYPDKAKDIKDSAVAPGEDIFDRVCRLAILQGNQSMTAGDTYAHLTTIQHTWLRNFAFEFIQHEQHRDELKEKFPEGVRVSYAGETFLEAVPENMDECLTIYMPIPGDGQAGIALGESLIPVQKRVNNLHNLAQETYERGTPAKFVDAAAVDTDAMADQVASPEIWVPIKRKPGENLADSFYKEAPTQVGGELMGMLTNLQGTIAQQVSCVQPSMFGGSMTNAKTAAVYAQARDQSLAALSLSYGPLKSYLANITEMAVHYASQRDEDEIHGIVPDSVGSGYRNVKVSIQKLRAGTYKCKPQVDDAFPESYSAQRSNFMQLMQTLGTSPEGQKLFMHPDNQRLLKKMTGIEALEIPGADSSEKQMKEIEECLDGEPIEPTPDEMEKVTQHATMMQMSGQPSPQLSPDDLMRSSVPIDQEFDIHDAELAECSRWLNSDEGQKAKLLNPKGFTNVRLHALAHKRAMQNQAATIQDTIPDPRTAMQGAVTRNAMATAGQSGQQAQPQQNPQAALMNFSSSTLDDTNRMA